MSTPTSAGATRAWTCENNLITSGSRASSHDVQLAAINCSAHSAVGITVTWASRMSCRLFSCTCGDLLAVASDSTTTCAHPSSTVNVSENFVG